MKTYYCFLEKEGEEFERFCAEHEEDTIHLYSSIVQSCEDNLFYCFGEMYSIFLEHEEQVSFVTDDSRLYEIAQEICVGCFAEIIYLEQGVETGFSGELTVSELMQYELARYPKEISKRIGVSLYNVLRLGKAKELVDIAHVLLNMVEKQRDEKEQAFWLHIVQSVLYAWNRKQEYLTREAVSFALSMQMKFRKDATYTNAYLKHVLEEKSYGAANYYYVWNQCKAASLRKFALFDSASREMTDALYQRSYEEYRRILAEELTMIPKDERNRDRVVVFTIQYLGADHAPTKTVMERVKTLVKMGKEVYLINTAEQYCIQGYIPTYATYSGVVDHTYDSKETMQIGETEVWFRQLSNDTAVINNVRAALQHIREIKPYYMLSVGTGSMIADLCGNVIPCASMALAFSTLPHTMNPMKILGRQFTEEEKKEGMQGVIESRFTFELKPQKRHYMRSQLKLPEDKFLIVIVGIRLDYEMDASLLQVLTNVCKEGCHVVFAGHYESYDKMCSEWNEMKEHSTFIGYCDDMLALMEICDLYVNPKRLGGGFSIIEAFEKGVPGVYLKNGDVYTSGGEAHAVDSFEQMQETILRYKNDKVFYEEMARKGRERAAYMTDSVPAMQELDQKIVARVQKEMW